jgi:hypothetical protein
VGLQGRADATCPDHIRPFVTPPDKAIVDRLPVKPSDNYAVFAVRCSCGADLFSVQADDLPTVVGACGACGAKITLYDIRNYPAGTPSRQPGPMRRIAAPTGEGMFRVYVGYEYGDLDEDQEPDANDVTWGCVFGIAGEGTPTVFEILSDETA